MITIVLALTVGLLFTCGIYMILRREQIKMLLGLGLLSHGVNLMLFGTGALIPGSPPLFIDKENYLVELAQGPTADPLPQALILTAIVISFGITAFMIVLVSRRHTIANTDLVHGELAPLLMENDPFEDSQSLSNSDRSAVDYDWLAYEVDEVYDRAILAGTAVPSQIPEQSESAAMEKDEY